MKKKQILYVQTVLARLSIDVEDTCKHLFNVLEQWEEKPQETPPKPKRGRPLGSKNKARVKK
jgi:hypothetical protein